MKKTARLLLSFRFKTNIPFKNLVSFYAGSKYSGCTGTRRNMQAGKMKKLFAAVAGMIAFLSVSATNYYNVTGAADANNLANWTTSAGGTGGTNPASFTAAGDVFNLRNGQAMALSADLNIADNAFNIVGTGSLDCKGFVLLGNAGSIFSLSATGTLKIGSADGITPAGTALGNIQTGTRNFSTGGNAGNFEYNAINGNQVTGAGLPVNNILSLTVNTATNVQVVSLTNTGTTKIGSSNSQSVGSLILSNGVFKIGAGNIIEFISTQSGGNVTNNGGNLATTGTDGADGGTVLSDAQSGGGFLIGGSGQTTFYNFTFVQNATLNFASAATPSFIINGTFTIPNNNWGWGSNAKSPVYGAASTLSVNRTGQVPLTSQGLEWIGTPTATPTIGVTPGYPNNVILTTTSTSTSNFTGNRGLNGTLTLNSNSRLDLTGITGDFVVGGSILFNGTGSVAQPNITAPTTGNIIVKGNWQRNTAAVFAANNGTAVVFAGGGTQASPQIISVSTGTENQFSNVKVNNATYVKLNSPVTLGASGTLTLLAGIIETNTANILSISNTAPGAIAGGSAAAFINGPVKWNLAATSTNSYLFPVGKGTTYLPFTLAPNSSAANIATVEAFNTNSGGTPDATTITSLSTTEYWSLTTSAAFSTGASISVSRPTAITPFNGLGKSTTANGIYSSVGGTPGTFGVNNSASIGKTSPWFFALGVAPLAVQAVSITDPNCVVQTSTVTVAGTGGTPPYTYQLDNLGFASNNIFAGLLPGSVHTVTVRDAGTPAPGTATITVNVPDFITLTKDTAVCPGASVNLLAAGLGSNYSWSPATGLSATNIANPVATPPATTTYTVTAQLETNLIVNPDFESGNAGFTSDYIYLSGSQIPFVFAGAVVGNPHNGVYGIVPTNNSLCTQFNPTLQDHTSGAGLMFVCDGPDDGTGLSKRAWSQTVNGLATNTNYTFSYWLRSAASGNPASMKAQINGVDLTGAANPVNSTTAWVQISYTWNSGAASSAAIDVYDLDNNDIGNDFMLDDMAFISTCIVSKSVTVTVNNTSVPPVVSTVQPTCSTATGTITVTSPASGVTYSFDNGVSFGASATSGPLAAGTYQVLVQSGTCTSAAATVTINTAPSAPAAPTVTITQPTCTVATGTITVTAPATGVTYSFDNGVTFGANATSAALTAGTTYQVMVNAGGCLSTAAAATINTAPSLPAAPTAAATQPTCSVTTGTITVSAPATGVTYSFDNGLTFGASATSNTLAPGATYQVVVKNTSGCNSPATAVVVNAVPTAPAAPTATATQPTCTVATGSITVTAPSTGVTYSFDNGVSFGAAATSGSLTAGSTYQVVVNAGGCLSAATAVIINTQPAPATVNAGSPRTIATGSSVTLAATASAGQYAWSPAGSLSNPAILHPVATPPQTTTYTLTVTTAGGCTATGNVVITVTGDCLNPPNIFTPNNDGMYDQWIVFNGLCVQQLRVDVYNRWGGLVFHSDRYDNKWNGSHSGQPLPDGTYYYVIKATYNDGRQQQRTGNVTIMR